MKVLYVNVYMENRSYGGPEEGGWWYDVGDPLKSMPVVAKHGRSLREQAERVRRRVQAWCERRNRDERRPSTGSVACVGCYGATVEDHPARAYPEARPYYE